MWLGGSGTRVWGPQVYKFELVRGPHAISDLPRALWVMVT